MKMRLVAINGNCVWVQFKTRGEWTQEIMTHAQFALWLENHFPELAASCPCDDCAEYYYNFGETEQMRRKGVAHVYEGGV